MPDKSAGADIDPAELVEQVKAYMRRNRLAVPAMALHAGISANTLRFIIERGRRPRLPARSALSAAIAKQPPKKPDPPYSDIVREDWGKVSSEAIGARVGVSGARIRAIAKAIGLTGDHGAA